MYGFIGRGVQMAVAILFLLLLRLNLSPGFQLFFALVLLFATGLPDLLGWFDAFINYQHADTDLRRMYGRRLTLYTVGVLTSVANVALLLVALAGPGALGLNAAQYRDAWSVVAATYLGVDLLRTIAP